MEGREVRRLVRRRVAEFCREQARDPGVFGDPDVRARHVDAWLWMARYVTPRGDEFLSVLAANLRPLVTPIGTPPDGAPAEWSADHDHPDRREDPLPG